MKRNPSGILRNGFVDEQDVQSIIQTTIDEMGILTADDVAPITMTFSPAEGGAIALPSTGKDLFINLTPSIDLNRLVITLPPEDNRQSNQRLIIRSSRQIAEIEVNGATVVDNSIVMLLAGGVTVFFKFAPNLWSRTV